MVFAFFSGAINGWHTATVHTRGADTMCNRAFCRVAGGKTSQAFVLRGGPRAAYSARHRDAKLDIACCPCSAADSQRIHYSNTVELDAQKINKGWPGSG